MKKFFSNPAMVALTAFFCCLLWGSAFPFVKIGFAEFGISHDDIASEILFAGVRFSIAGAMVIAVSSLIEKRLLYPTRDARFSVLKLALFQTVLQYFFYYIGLANTSGVNASVIVGTGVFTTLIISCLIFRMESFTVRKTVGCLMGFAGIVLINSGASGSGLTLRGDGFIFISTVASAFSSVMVKRYSQRENPMMLSGWQFFTGGCVMAVGAFAAGGRLEGFSVRSVSVLLYLAFISAAAYTLWSVLMKYNPVSEIAVFGFMKPIFGVLLSAIFLGEYEKAFRIQNLFALICVCVGILAVNRRKTSTSS